MAFPNPIRALFGQKEEQKQPFPDGSFYEAQAMYDNAQKEFDGKAAEIINVLPNDLANMEEVQKKQLVNTYLMNRLTEPYGSNATDEAAPNYIKALQSDLQFGREPNATQSKRLETQLQVDQALKNSPNKESFEKAITEALPALRSLGNAKYYQSLYESARGALEEPSPVDLTPSDISKRAEEIQTKLSNFEAIPEFQTLHTNNVERINQATHEINTLRKEILQSAMHLQVLPQNSALQTDFEQKEKAIKGKIRELHVLLHGIHGTAADLGNQYTYTVYSLYTLDQAIGATTLAAHVFGITAPIDQRDESQKVDYEQNKDRPKGPMFITKSDYTGKSQLQASEMEWNPTVAAAALRELREQYIDKSQRGLEIFGKALFEEKQLGLLPGAEGIKLDKNGGINKIYFKNEATLDIFLKIYEKHYKQKMEAGKNTEIEAKPEEENSATITPANQASIQPTGQNSAAP